MVPEEDPENGDRSPPEKTESTGEPTPETTQRSNQPDASMTDQSPREELKESFDRNQLMKRNIDMALDVVLRTNPAENILRNIDDEELQEQSRDQVQFMMNEWLDMYRDLLEEGRPLPQDLIAGIESLELFEPRELFPDEIREIQDPNGNPGLQSD